jgi:hypothetical protein
MPPTSPGERARNSPSKYRASSSVVAKQLSLGQLRQHEQPKLQLIESLPNFRWDGGAPR